MKRFPPLGNRRGPTLYVVGPPRMVLVSKWLKIMLQQLVLR